MNKKVYDLTNPQKSIWYTEQYYNDTTVNNICTSGTIYGKIDKNLLKQAINNVVKQNDSFRIHIFLENNVAKQYIADYKEFDIDIVYINDESEIEKIAKEEVKHKFNVIESDLFKFKIVISKNNFTCIILTVNHLIADSWSLGLVVQEILRNYNCLKNNQEITIDTFSYVDYIDSEKEYKSSKKFENDKSYWAEIFETIPEQATIPSLNNNIKDLSYNAKRLSFEINKNLLTKINDFCRENNISTFNFFMAIFSIYIGRVSNIDDFVIGTPILNRTNFREKHTTGMFVNTVPVRVTNLNSGTFKELSNDFAKKMMGILRHQKYSYNSVLEDLRAKNQNVPNLYNIAISYQITKAFDEKYGNYKTNWIFNNYCANDFNIHIYDANDTGNLTVNYDYLIDKYSDEDVTNVHNRIIHMINQVLDNHNINSSDIEIVTPEEKNKILNVFNNTKTDYPRDKTITDIFEEQVEKHPNNYAIVFNDEKLTYKEFNEQANQLARYLKKQGVEAHDNVVILLDKSVDMYIAIIAILKLGALYVPVDSEYPQYRINTIIEDCNPKVIIVDNKYKNLVQDKNICIFPLNCLESYEKTNIKNAIKPEDGAYIIYTSGSTGKPKGVIVPHRGVVRLVINTNYIEFKENDRILQNIAIVFDASVFAIFGALLNGLPLYPIQKDQLLDFAYFEKFIKDNKITIINLTVSLFNKLIDYNPNFFSEARAVLIGGEAVLPKTVNVFREHCPNVKIINVYGPTENSDLSCCHIIDKNYEISVPIGKPISNSTCYILDKNLNLQPIGVPGEIYVGGDGVALGYLNRDDLTSEVFVPNIFEEGKLYKTGDSGYWEKDGLIQFISRIDQQVKIRGFRIELKEIQTKILEYGKMQECDVIVAENNSSKVLVACIGTKEPINIQDLKTYLKSILPFYMVPSKYIVLESLPLNINGKLDKKKLLEYLTHIDDEEEILEPTNEIEENLIKIWEKVLGIKNIGINKSFFEIGGDSLSAITMSQLVYEKYHIKISIKNILNNLTIEDLSSIIQNSQILDNIDIKKISTGEFYPLSSAQKRIYYTSKMIGNNNLVYNVSGGILINKILDKNKVEKCFKEIIKKQSSFRTSFILENNDIKQQIKENVDFDIPFFESKSSEIKNIINEFPKPFDLGKAPLLRVAIHYLDNGKTLLLLDSHHIIMDGSSLEILINDFCKLYNGENIENLDIEYKDFSVWENEFLESDMVKESENYWLQKFKDSEIPAINLPYDFSVPSSRTYKGNTISKQISEKDFDKYLISAKKFGVSPYMFFLSALFVLLYKYTGQEEIIIGSPVTGRNTNQLQNIIGMFVNNIAIDGKIDSSKKFAEFLNTIKQQVLSDLEYQNYPYNLLVKKLDIPSDSTNNPLFDVMFAYQNANSNKLTLNGESVEIIKSVSNISKFNLSIEIEPDTRVVNLEYRTDLFKEDTINRLFEHFINTLNMISENNDISIKDISIISDEEKNKILYEFNATATNYPNDKAIIELFENQVKKTPNNIALVFENNSLTYKELNEKANQLANYIKDEGFMPEDIICILLDKSIEMIIAILAILKNRCAYLPIDITYPKDRIEYIIKDSNSKLLLTSKNINTFNLSIKSIYIDLDNNNIYNSNHKDNISMIRNSNDLAYIMYTSGSTGNPKGVMIENKSISRLIINNNYIKFCKDDRILQTGSIVFDACTFEIWGAFLNGLPLYIIKKEDLLDSNILHEYILKNNITVLWLTAPLFNQLCESNPHMFRTVRCLLTGGDVLSPKHINMAKLANPNLIIINGYGPTENTTFSCCHQIDKTYTDSIPIGGPISNSTCYVVSKDTNLQPIGIPGELWVGGDGVARGYFNNDKMTSDKFIYSSLVNTRVYKTGDLVKWNSDGYLEFLGRIDNQIKIRGFRVELSEITTVINSYEGIKECYTIFDTVHNQKSLCSYIVADKKIDFEDLKNYLSKQLPKYMIPTYFMQLDTLPINQNGKVNKKLLPRNFKVSNTKNIVLPSSDLEKKIYDIFMKVLNISDFSITDNFFSLSGDSISAMKLEVEALKNNINITYGDIFKYPSVKDLATYINSSKKNEHISEKIDNSFEKIDSILKRNTVETLFNISPNYTPINNVLLTGVTGFLGSHILDSFIKNTSGKIYCLIRPKNNISAKERLKSTLNFYFDDNYNYLIDDRIICVEGDITKNHLGLDNDDYIKLGNDITTVIHSAALVKHFGNYEEFKNINVDGTKNLITFSKDFNCRLMHISTISVSGNNFAEGSFIENDFTEDINYDETKFYINQNLENLYVKSKFLAEKLVFEAIDDGLNAYVLRMGNLTSRYSEGKFQQNHYENAFVNRIKSLLQIGAIPEYMQEGYVEFTPIDCCADAIINIANHYNPAFSVFHVFNEKHVQLLDLYDMLDKIGINVNIVSTEDFNTIIDNLLKDDNSSDILSGIIRDFNSEKKLIYQSNIKIKSDFTKKFLENIGFEWPYIDINYIRNYFKYLIDIGYLNVKLKEI